MSTCPSTRSRLIEFGAEIRRRFANPVAHISDFTREGDRFSIEFTEPVVVDHVVLREDITEGHKVRRFRITAQPYIPSEEDIHLYETTGIGHKAICPFPAIYVKKLMIDILESDGPYRISDLCAYSPEG